MSEDRNRNFLRHYTPVQGALMRYVCCLHPNFSEVEDLLQDVVVVAWEKFPEFEAQGGDFRSWIFAVARYKILNSKRQYLRSCRKLDAARDKLAESAAIELASASAERQQALARCLGKLSDKHQQLLARRYSEKASCQDLAVQMRQSETQIRSQLYRLRNLLRDCITEATR
ncbi:MAG: hypothetical protein RL095_826 [Verrucomicrobiota bacterium]|jgi:RNA polymerase sigma-70 factor (ECF subfamily)